MSSIPFDLTPDALRAESAALRGLSRALLRHEQDSEDVAQETWVAALQHPPARSDGRSAWLARVTRNFALRRRRKDAARQRWEREAARPEAMPSTLESLERVELHRQIVEAVLALNEPYRTTVVLRFWEDLPAGDVARRMRVPVSTVHTRVGRALAILRQRLDQSFGDRSAWTGLLAFGLDSAPAVGATTVAATTVPAASLVLAGALLMTTKAKLAAVAAVCAVVLATLWALQEPSGEGGLGAPAQDPGGGRLVAEGEDAGKLTTESSQDPTERTEVPTQPAANPKLGSLLVSVVWADDKKPAAGVLLRAWNMTGNRLPDRDAGISDQNGRLRVQNLEPGRLFVQSFRGDLSGGQKRVTIEAGRETRVQIVVPIGIHLSGIVVDQGGAPVPHATLIAAPYLGRGRSAAPIGRSGADGRFQLRSIGAQSNVGARAKGHAPSPLHSIDAAKGSHVELRLVLGGRGGGVFGRVLDPLGKPVPKALVQVGEGPVSRIRLPDDTPALAPVPVRVLTDEDGHFVVEGLAPGRSPVAVHGQGLAPSSGSVEVVTGGESELRVHLLPAAILSGTVRDDDGEPLAKALVEAVCAGNRVFGNRWVRTKADGTYRLKDLSPGKLQVTAVAEGSRLETELVVVAGQTLQWNPVVSTGKLLRGRVLDTQDRPVAKAQLHTRLEWATSNSWSQLVQTDKEGWFTLKGFPPDKKLRITVGPKGYALKNIVVKPDDQELIIRVQALGKPSVFITGQVVAPDGKPVTHARVHAICRTHSTPSKLLTEADAGRFKFGPLAPGEFSVYIQARGHPGFQAPFKKLNEGDTWDLGVIRLQRGGFLQVELKGDVTLTPLYNALLIYGNGNTVSESVLVKNGRVSRSRPLVPGTYHLEVVGKNCLYGRHRFTIHADQETRLEVVLERGIPVVLEFEVQADGKRIPVAPGGILVEVRGSAGKRAMNLQRPAMPVRNNPRLHKLEFTTKPGKHKVIATTRSGERAEATLTVGDKAAAAPQRIVLR